MKKSINIKNILRWVKAWAKTVNGSIIISVAVGTLGAMLFLPTAGIISTFPVALLLSFGAAYTIKQFYYIPIAFFAMTYMFSHILGQPVGLMTLYGGYSLRMALRAAAISLLGCLVAVLIKNMGKIIKSKTVTVILSVVLSAVALVWVGYSNGTPWGIINANNEINSYVDTHFDMQGVNKTRVYYVAETGSFGADFDINGEEYKSTLFLKTGDVSENVTDMFSTALSEDGRVQLTALLRKTFPEGNFSVSCEYSGVYSKKLSLKDTDSVSNFLKYTVDIYDMTNAKSFVKLTEEFYTAVMKSGFDCENLTLNGGIRRKMYYTISGNPYIPRSDSADRLKLYGDIVMPMSSIEIAKSAD